MLGFRFRSWLEEFDTLAYEGVEPFHGIVLVQTKLLHQPARDHRAGSTAPASILPGTTQ